MLWPLPDLRPLRYYYCAVMWAVQIQIALIFPNHSGLNLYAALVKGLELFFIWILRTGPYPILEPSAELYPARISFFFKGSQKCLHLPPTVFLRNLTERGDPLLPFVLATYPKVSSPRAPRWRQRNQPACWGGAAFLFHNKTWTIIPTLGSLRVYVHPWLGTVSFRFLPCSRYQNSRKCVHTLQTYLTRNPFSRTNTTPTHT